MNYTLLGVSRSLREMARKPISVIAFSYTREHMKSFFLVNIPPCCCTKMIGPTYGGQNERTRVHEGEEND